MTTEHSIAMAQGKNAWCTCGLRFSSEIDGTHSLIELLDHAEKENQKVTS